MDNAFGGSAGLIPLGIDSTGWPAPLNPAKHTKRLIQLLAMDQENGAKATIDASDMK